MCPTPDTMHWYQPVSGRVMQPFVIQFPPDRVVGCWEHVLFLFPMLEQLLVVDAEKNVAHPLFRAPGLPSITLRLSTRRALPSRPCAAPRAALLLMSRASYTSNSCAAYGLLTGLRILMPSKPLMHGSGPDWSKSFFWVPAHCAQVQSQARQGGG